MTDHNHSPERKGLQRLLAEDSDSSVKQFARLQHNERSCAPENSRTPAIADDMIALAYSFHFTWGYPDYIHQAITLLCQPGGVCEAWGIDHQRDLTWKQLRQLFEEADSPRLRYLVAGNPATTSSVLNFLSDDKDPLTVRRVAENVNTHASTLARLALSSDYLVRMCICENAAAPELILFTLSQDQHPDVRYRLAENVHAPASIIELLTVDENPFVAARAIRTLGALRPAEVLLPDFSRVARRRVGRAAGAT